MRYGNAIFPTDSLPKIENKRRIISRFDMRNPTYGAAVSWITHVKSTDNSFLTFYSRNHFFDICTVELHFGIQIFNCSQTSFKGAGGVPGDQTSKLSF